uniref:Transposon protein, putative, CACTA, En/Spm sub-class n=1 Tax=Oryza sativa subsp. japonica TaxID=39947 RepID=Q53K79_ORYSJ|nr:hypothetical protein [Oryza sativa Japonica Group]ABF97743.1 transposon protein, putative, CACTA, En/Spm sub-class [Oryza sativa Japonica Group]
MDRQWMYADRRSKEFIDGVHYFLRVAEANRQRGFICCPCNRCKNQKEYSASRTIHFHLFESEFMPSYNCWTSHGEQGVEMEEDEVEDDNIPNFAQYVGFEGNQTGEEEIAADGNDVADDLGQMLQDAREDCESEKEAHKLDKMLEDHRTSLYPGCEQGHKKLDTTMELLQWKAKNGVSDKAFGDLLKLVKNILPGGNKLPETTYEAKKIVCPLGLEVHKIHACPNDCILYRGEEYENLEACPVCKALRYKIRRDDPGEVDGQLTKKRIPAKVMWYFPIIPRLRRLFRNKGNARMLRWHAEERQQDGMLRHPADGSQWRNIDRKFKEFGKDGRNIRFGPKQPGNDIDVYLRPLVEDLKQLWKKEGVPVWDEDKQEEFNLRALLFVTINDWPALSNLSGQSNKGYKACTHCMDETEKKTCCQSRPSSLSGRASPRRNWSRQMADRDEEQILYDTIAEGSSQYWNEEEGNEDPNQYLNEEGNVERDAEGNQQGHVERDVEGNQEEEASGSQPSVGQKRARGQRGAAKKLEGRHIITEVEEDGRPSAPAEAAKNYVRHSGWVVQDNVPVSTVYWRRTRARGDHESFVPDSEKEMLWTTMLETFTLPAGTEDKVKRWTLKKMAEQFQSFKGDLYQKYILKGQTPNFDTFPKLRDHWDEFVAYKTGEQGQAMMERNKENAAKKYHHHLGSGGYSVAMPKWEQMEASLIERGIEPATANWPERSKFWYYAHGGTLNPADGSLVFGDQIREAARRLTDAVEASSQGTFRPDRDRDELTLALQTPEHPGRTRGKGVIPWKIGFKEDIHTYRSRMRSKRDTEAKIADLEFRVSSYELNMQEEVARKVDERMAAHRSHDPQPTIPPAMVSPSGNRSSYASTGQVGSQNMDTMQTQDESTCPVDDITQRTPCELHIPFKNLSIKVASGMAIPTDPSGTYHCRPIPAGYSKVEVELVEGAYEDLELDYPGGDGGTSSSLGDKRRLVHHLLRLRHLLLRILHRLLLMLRQHRLHLRLQHRLLRILHRLLLVLLHLLPRKLLYRHLQSQGPPPAPPPAHTRATKKAKVDAAKNKDPGYDCTQEELDAYVASEIKRQFKPRSPEKKIPIDPSVRNFFRGMSASVKEAIKLSDYEQTLKKASSGKSKPVPQLGEQLNQEIEPLVTGKEMTIEQFITDTGLTTDQLLGVAPIEKAEVKYMYELGKPLVKPELLQSLPTQMYKFHQLYMEMSATGREMIGARIRDTDFLQGDDILWINFREIYELYQLDALDVSIMSCWILMEIQRARRRRVFDTGFIDPRKVNVAMLDQYPQETEDNLVHLLKAQHYKTFILLPYNTEFYWVLLLFDLEACTVNVYDSMDKKESTFDKCAKQKQGTNLCGYYVCEYCHCLADQIITTRELDFIRMRDNLTTHKEFIAAVQEQLMGFINEEILDPKGEFYYDGNTIHRSLASELAASTTTSKS